MTRYVLHLWLRLNGKTKSGLILPVHGGDISIHYPHLNTSLLFGHQIQCCSNDPPLVDVSRGSLNLPVNRSLLRNRVLSFGFLPSCRAGDERRIGRSEYSDFLTIERKARTSSACNAKFNQFLVLSLRVHERGLKVRFHSKRRRITYV